MALDDVLIVLDRNPARIDVEPGQQGRDRERLLELEAFAVESDLHWSTNRAYCPENV